MEKEHRITVVDEDSLELCASIVCEILSVNMNNKVNIEFDIMEKEATKRYSIKTFIEELLSHSDPEQVTFEILGD